MPRFSSCVFVFPFCRSLHLMRKCCQQKGAEASPRPPAGPTSLSAGRQNHSSIPFLEGQLQTRTRTQVGKAQSVSSHCVPPPGNVLEKSSEVRDRKLGQTPGPEGRMTTSEKIPQKQFCGRSSIPSQSQAMFPADAYTCLQM